MLVAGLVVSAVAVLLGIFTKLPQGGGGFVNNLRVMSCFLPSPQPYLPTPPPPMAVFFDVDAATFEPRKGYVHQLAMTCNLTQGPMPGSYTKPRPASNPPPRKATFSIPNLSLLLLPSLSPLLLKIGKAIANIAMIFMVLSLSWLACTQLPLLAKIQKATNDSLTIATVSGDHLAGIETHYRLFYDLQIQISEYSKALAEVERVTMQAKEKSKNAIEREREMEQMLKRLEKERDDAFKDLVGGRENFERLEKQKDEEAERLKQENNSQVKAWEEKERVWEEKSVKERKIYVEEKDSLKMGRERERESWMGQMERLKTAKGEEKEKLESKIEKILKEKDQEKNIWWKEKEEELRKRERLEIEREEERKSVDAQRLADSDARGIMNTLAQQRIAKLEEENAGLRNAAMEREKGERDRKAARAISEGERGLEKKRWEEQLAEAKKLVSKMEQDLLSGRKLIQDLQNDKRIDRQLLLELRAQLARPAYHAPPTHLSPLRFNGTAYSVLAAPNFTPFSAPPIKFLQTLPSGSPFTLPTTLSSVLSSGDPFSPEIEAASPIVRLPPANPEPQPIFRLPPPPPPPPRQENPSRLPTRNEPPANAPKGPKGWWPDVPKRPEETDIEQQREARAE